MFEPQFPVTKGEFELRISCIRRSYVTHLGNYFRCKRFTLQTTLWVPELVIQINLEHRIIISFVYFCQTKACNDALQKVFQNFEKSCLANPRQKTSECVFNKVVGVDFRTATFLKKSFPVGRLWKNRREVNRVTTSDNEWQRVIANDRKWQRVVQQVITNNNECYNEWQQVVERVTTNDNEWQQMTMTDSEGQRVVQRIKAVHCTSKNKWLPFFL